MTTKIKFGTDGWRALIARDFTFENVALVTKAVADTFESQTPDRKRVTVGYDRRFLSKAFAETAATVYAKSGFDVLLASSYLPTPAISWTAKNETGMAGATMITASHNPPEWNGYKVKESMGGSARPRLTVLFEKRIEELQKQDSWVPNENDFKDWAQKGKIKTFDPLPKYFEAVRKMIDVDLIRKAKFSIALDVMHGAASKYYAELLASVGVETKEIHGEDNPGFRGVPPEPIGKNITELCDLVRQGKFACGLATDGDADRLGAVDEHGTPFTTQMILSVVYWHMLKNKKKRWSISRSASTTKMVDLIANKYGFACIETPVGFKYIADKMVAGEAQIGGEESGGIGIIDHLPERDGPLTGLLLLELMATEKKGLRAIYDQLCKEIRPYEFIREDIHLSDAQAEKAMRTLAEKPPQEWEGRKLDVLSKIDGFKFYLKDGSWLLIRKSGTEPIFRLYAETESLPACQKLIDAARNFVKNA